MSDRAMLPIDEVLPHLLSVLRDNTRVVLEAPPGAGKTTRVPLAMLEAPWHGDRRIVMLEPRRLAARNAAAFMARSLGEQVGETVGYRVRGDTRVGRRTRVEIVTEGVLARIRAEDAALEQYGAVIFDEFHERSLHADLGLALVLQSQEILRPDLRLLVMSATLDGDAVAACIGTQETPAPVVRSSGQMFPVVTSFHPPRAGERIEAAVARATREALSATEGDILVFLPGLAEQNRTAALLSNVNEGSVDVHILHGTQSFAEQEAAIAASRAGRRKIVLSTSVAETSITIEGVRAVVDSGLTRQPRYSARTGLSRLETVRVSKASANQRRGRAGRVAPGWCFRVWDEHEDATLEPRTRPEILDTDLAALALELADAGVKETSELRWLDQPPAGMLAQSRELLVQLGAVDGAMRITQHGKRMAGLPLHPRLAHMLVLASERGLLRVGSTLAALLEERDVLRGERDEVPSDLRLRVEIASRTHDAATLGSAHVAHDVLHRVRDQARALLNRMANGDARAVGTPVDEVAHVGMLLAMAYPDRIAQRRPGRQPRFLLRNGSGAVLPVHDALASSEYLAVAHLEGAPPDYRVARAAPVTLEEIRELFAAQVVRVATVAWDDDARAVRAAETEKLGALTLSERRISKPDAALVVSAVKAMLESTGVAAWPISASAIALRERLAFLHAQDDSWPDVSDHTLLRSMDEWLSQHLSGVNNWRDIEQLDWHTALMDLVPWSRRALLETLAPAFIQVPSGSRIRVDYSNPEAPVLAVKLQEVFGWTDTPRILEGRVPVTLHLLSPAQRPVQVTRDLAGFWRSGYADVRKELRGRYPRHPWPDDPLTAQATRRAKPRGT